MTVRSPGGATVTQTCPGERILHHLGTKPLNLVSLTVTGGSGHPGGGAVFSAGPTEIHFSTYTGNTTDTADADPFWTGTGGGAVSVLTTVVIRSSVFIGNSSTNSLYPQWAAGGAVWASAGGSITSSRFEQNTAQTGGGDVTANFYERRKDIAGRLHETLTGNALTTEGRCEALYDALQWNDNQLRVIHNAYKNTHGETLHHAVGATYTDDCSYLGMSDGLNTTFLQKLDTLGLT